MCESNNSANGKASEGGGGDASRTRADSSVAHGEDYDAAGYLPAAHRSKQWSKYSRAVQGPQEEVDVQGSL